VNAAVTVHAGGVWAGAAPGAPVLRPLRGSHLVFARDTLPLRHGVAWLHPGDRRPVFAHVWEGAVLVGTTDVDHPVADVPATISPAEADYLVAALRLPFPTLRVDARRRSRPSPGCAPSSSRPARRTCRRRRWAATRRSGRGPGSSASPAAS
jgi:glycerol-3-phosphate dehydrogenase